MLPQGKAALDELREMAAEGTVTLVTAARDLAESHVAVLRPLLV